jgi:hypothetical protein
MSEKEATAGDSSNRAPWNAKLRCHSSRSDAAGSMGVPSLYCAATSTPRAANAISSVSVAVHIANRKPPPST